MKKTFPNEHSRLWGSRLLPYIIPAVIGTIFIYLTINTPLTSTRGLGVQLTIIIPEIIIWFIATIGAFRFKRYAISITDHPDGRGLNHIANSLILLFIYIILLTTASTIVNLFSNSEYLNIAIALRNHLPIIVALASVLLLLKGSTGLCKIISKNSCVLKRKALLVGSSILFFAIFGYAFYKAEPNTILVNGIPRFALPVQLLLVTYVLPHVAIWFIGFRACLNLISYASNVTGLVYKSLFSDLYRGILVAFFCIFAAQFLIISTVALSLSNSALILIYGILILAAAGFLLILRGAKKLDRIETTAQ